MAADFDPRFDPAFQRGYDGRMPGPVVEPVRPVVERVGSVVEPVETPPPAVELVEASAEPLRYETRGNPWLRALWVVAAVFTVTGLLATYAAQSLMQGANTSSAIDYYVLPLTVSQLAPWFTVTGLFAGVAALVLNAIRWRPGDQ
ncbi:MAG TPA: hypothetical protein PLY19_04695 [Rhodoglobus sp.]|nr:hypothetical protein [Rhodoglobus sp.]HQJ35313.1 hypothetical protein [Rhodoglobus sp.]